MPSNRSARPIRLVAGLLTSLLFAIATIPLGAQTAPESHRGHGFGPVYDATREVTLKGTVQEVVTKHNVGSPVGTHLLVTGADGIVDAHVGSFLAKDTEAALHTGLPVELVGAMTTLHGKQYLLVRQITFGGRVVEVRNEHGALVHAHAPRTAHHKVAKVSQTVVNGGAR